MMNFPRISVFVGGYGSGKTEIALNAAIYIRQTGKDVTLVDLDIVNPYFRSAEHRDMLKSKGVDIITPVFATTTVDVPALAPDIKSLFDVRERSVVIDVGGDDAGSSAAGQYAALLRREGASVFFVVNACRPLTSDVNGILAVMSRVSGKSRLTIDGIVSNSNLGDATTIDEAVNGFRMCEAVSARTGVPIVAVTGDRLAGLPNDMQSLYVPITRFTRPEFFDAI